MRLISLISCSAKYLKSEFYNYLYYDGYYDCVISLGRSVQPRMLDDDRPIDIMILIRIDVKLRPRIEDMTNE